MKPQIKFIYNKKTTSLDIRIKLYGTPAGLYSTGLSVSANSFDNDKQICGDISVMAYMNLAKATIEKNYRPGDTPETMWADYLKENGEKATINDAFTYYLQVMKLADATKESFANVKTKVEKAGMLQLPLDQVNAAIVRQFVNGLQGEESTIHLTYVKLKTVVTRYIKDHNLNINLSIDGIAPKPRRKTADEEELEYLTFEEVKDLLAIDLNNFIEDADIESKKENEGSQNMRIKNLTYARDIFIFMCFTGLSISDLLRFTPDMLSRDQKWLLYKRTKTMRKGKQCRVPILPITRQLIHKYEWPTRLKTRTIQWYCSDKISKLVGKRVSPHTARHSFGSIMLYFGFSMESVREMMGHSSVAITEQIYAKVTKEKIEREMKEIPKKMNELLTL